MRDWLALLGYEVVLEPPLSLQPPLGSRGRRADSGVSCAAACFNPLPAGAYLIKARKHVYTLTPIRPPAARASASCLAASSSPPRARDHDGGRDLHGRGLPRQPRARRLGRAVARKDQQKELSGAEPQTTNNRMELMGAIMALARA